MLAPLDRDITDKDVSLAVLPLNRTSTLALIDCLGLIRADRGGVGTEQTSTA